MSSVWDRVAVIGCCGAGKSTLARKMAAALGSTHVELDDLHFASDWEPRPSDEFRADVSKATAPDRWVSSGNYRAARDIVWGRATAVVWLDLSFATCFRRIVFRSLGRCWSGELACGGNRETYSHVFASRDSILVWLLRTHGPLRRDLPAELQSPEWSHLRVWRVRTAAAADRLLSEEVGVEPAEETLTRR